MQIFSRSRPNKATGFVMPRFAISGIRNNCSAANLSSIGASNKTLLLQEARTLQLAATYNKATSLHEWARINSIYIPLSRPYMFARVLEALYNKASSGENSVDNTTIGEKYPPWAGTSHKPSLWYMSAVKTQYKRDRAVNTGTFMWWLNNHPEFGACAVSASALSTHANPDSKTPKKLVGIIFVPNIPGIKKYLDNRLRELNNWSYKSCLETDGNLRKLHTMADEVGELW